MSNTIKKIHIKGSDLQYDYNSLANTPVIPSTVAELTDSGNYATTAYVESKISALPIDTEISSSSTNPVQNKVIKEYIDEGDKYPIPYKTVNGSGTIRAYKDAANSNRYDTIALNSRGGVVWIDRNYEKLSFEYSNAASLNFSRADTRNITNMDYMFSYLRGGVTNLDLSSFDTSNVESMYHMFSNSTALTSLDLSSFDTSNVKNIGGMFNECNSLSALDLSSFDTSNALSMSWMFSDCYKLTSLDVSNFNTSKMKYMKCMLQCCESLSALNVSNFDTSKVTDMSSMFYGCSALISLDVTNFNTTNVTDMSYMFSNCSSLASLNLSGWNTSNVADMSNMFNGCSALTVLTLSSSFFNSTALTEYDFSALPSWIDEESLANLVSVLPTITTAKTIKLSDNTKSVLRDEEKTTITTKGWTIG